MLKLHQVSKTFNPGTINEKKALKGIDLHLKPGDFVTVIGGNGAGKSTMLNAVAGVWPVDGGSVVIDGVDVTGMPEHVRAQYIGRVFQDPMTGTAPNMQIEENLALAARRGRKRGIKNLLFHGSCVLTVIILDVHIVLVIVVQLRQAQRALQTKVPYPGLGFNICIHYLATITKCVSRTRSPAWSYLLLSQG